MTKLRTDCPWFKLPALNSQRSNRLCDRVWCVIQPWRTRYYLPLSVCFPCVKPCAKPCAKSQAGFPIPPERWPGGDYRFHNYAFRSLFGFLNWDYIRHQFELEQWTSYVWSYSRNQQEIRIYCSHDIWVSFTPENLWWLTFCYNEVKTQEYAVLRHDRPL